MSTAAATTTNAIRPPSSPTKPLGEAPSCRGPRVDSISTSSSSLSSSRVSNNTSAPTGTTSTSTNVSEDTQTSFSASAVSSSSTYDGRGVGVKEEGGGGKSFFDRARDFGGKVFDTAREKLKEKLGVDEGKQLVGYLKEDLITAPSEETSKDQKALIDKIVAVTSKVAFHKGNSDDDNNEDDDEGFKGSIEDLENAKSETMKGVEEVIGQFMGLAVDKGFEMAKWAVTEFVPFGGALISISEYAVGGLTAMKDNKSAANEVIELIVIIVEKMPDYLLFFSKVKDGQGQKCLKKLAEMVVITMLLAKELSTQGADRTDRGIKFVLGFLNATDNASALAKHTNSLHQGMGMVVFCYGSDTIRHQQQHQHHHHQVEEQAPYLDLLSQIDPPVVDAVDFWKRSFKEKAPVAQVIQQLLLLAVKEKIVKAEDIRVLKLVPYYERFKMVLDIDDPSDYLTSVTEFVGFLSMYKKEDCDNYRVVDSVKVFIDSVSTSSINSSSSPPSSSAQSTAQSLVVSSEGGKGKVTNTAAERLSRLNVLSSLLSPIDFGKDLSDHYDKYMEGSRLWLFDEIKEWITSTSATTTPSRVFWVDGTGGLGKSIIAAKLVDISKLPKEKGGGWITIGGYFFCKHNDSKRKNPCQVIATLAYQLSTHIPEMEAALSKLDQVKLTNIASGVYNDFEKEVFEELLAKPLKEALSSWPADRRVCLLIDALDELDEGSPGRQQLLSLVGRGLLSLPSQVHVIVTSRPDTDIKAHLRLIKPCEIIKKDEKQRGDLVLFARKKIIDGTSLKLLPAEEQDEVVEILTGVPNKKDEHGKPDLGKSDGVFIAMQFSLKHLKKIQEDEKRDLTVKDLVSLPKELIYETYYESLERVYNKIKAMQISDKIRTTVDIIMKRILATLVASSRPLTVDELTNLCSGLDIQDATLTETLLSSLSLLFSFNTSGPIEPLHKTVYDFLLDKQRSKEYSVDVSEGHAILALSCARILRGGVLMSYSSANSLAACRAGGGIHSNNNSNSKGNNRSSSSSSKSVIDMFYEEIESLVKNDRMSSLDLYALEFGHAHLTKALQLLSLPSDRSSNGSRSSGLIGELLSSWETLLLTKRTASISSGSDKEGRKEGGGVAKSTVAIAVDAAIRDKLYWESDDKKHRFYKSDMMAKEGSLKWILLQAKLGRNNRFTVELDALKAAICSIGNRDGGIRNSADNVSSSSSNINISGSVNSVSDSVCNNNSFEKVESVVQERSSNASFENFLSTSVWLLGSYFNGDWGMRRKNGVGNSKSNSSTSSSSNNEGLKVSTQIAFQNAPVTCEWFESPVSIIWSQCKMTLPARVGISQMKSTLVGHSDQVTSASFSRDGTRIVSGSYDRSVVIWDALTGEVIQTLKGHSSYVESVSFSNDDSRIVSGSWDNSAIIWDALTGEILLTFRGHSGWVTSVSFNGDGSRVVSGSYDKTVKIWNALTGEVIFTLSDINCDDIKSVLFSSDGLKVVSSCGYTSIVWDALSGKVMQTLKGHSSYVSSVSFSSDGSKVVSGSNDNTVKIWDALTGGVILTLIGHSSWVTSVSFKNDGSRVVSGCWDKTVILWDALTGEAIQTLKGHSGIITSVAFCRDGSKIVSASADKSVIIWDALSKEGNHILYGLSDYTTTVMFNRDGSKILSGSDNNTVKVWDSLTGEAIVTLNGHSDKVESASFSSDGSKVMSISGKTVKVWDAMNGELLQSSNLEHFYAKSVSFNSDGSRIVTGSYGGTVKLWDALTGEVIHTLNGHSDDVHSVSFNSDGSRIVSGCFDNCVKVWDALRGERIFTLYGHSCSVLSVSFSSDGSRVVSGSIDCTIKVWYIGTAKPVGFSKFLYKYLSFAFGEEAILTLVGHSGSVRSVSFSSDDTRIVSGSDDKTVKVWDALTGEVMQTLFHNSSVTSVALSRNGSRIVSASADKTIKVWDVLTDEDVDNNTRKL